jgi:hypothetical protein
VTGPVTRTIDPDENKDWKFDWTDRLETAETISSHTVLVGTGLTLGTHVQASKTVTVWLSAGVANSVVTVTCRVVTSLGRTYEDKIVISVRAL